jgi:hypothetical protein
MTLARVNGDFHQCIRFMATVATGATNQPLAIRIGKEGGGAACAAMGRPT